MVRRNESTVRSWSQYFRIEVLILFSFYLHAILVCSGYVIISFNNDDFCASRLFLLESDLTSRKEGTDLQKLDDVHALYKNDLSQKVITGHCT